MMVHQNEQVAMIQINKNDNYNSKKIAENLHLSFSFSNCFFLVVCRDPTNIDTILCMTFEEVLHLSFLLQIMMMKFRGDSTHISTILLMTFAEILHQSSLLHIIITIFCKVPANIATILLMIFE